MKETNKKGKKGKELEGYGDPRFYEILKDYADTHSKKNQDYAKGSAQGHLGNFHRTSTWMQLYPGMDWATPFGVAILYGLKQLDAAMVLASTGRESITGEPIEARLKDVGVYSVIASILHSESVEKVRGDTIQFDEITPFRQFTKQSGNRTTENININNIQRHFQHRSRPKS